MKKFWISLLTVCVIFILTGTACLADVIWEPDNDFLSKHIKNVEYAGRNYYINGEKGKAYVYDDPESAEEFAMIVNGVRLTVHFTYKKGRTEWGLVEFNIDDDGNVENAFGESLTGWIPMDDLLLEYDSIRFTQEHSDEFYTFNGDKEKISEAGENTVLWTYPGSGNTINGMLIVEELDMWSVYDDDEGRQWGYVGYHYGTKDFWICISDPANANIPAFGAEEPDLIQPASVKSKLVEPGEGPNSLNNGFLLKAIIALVAAAVVSTAILIPVLMKKKAAKQDA